MTQRTSHQKDVKAANHAEGTRSSAGAEGSVVVPPAYGMDFVDGQKLIIQPKLKLGPVDDPYEREADQVSNDVLQHSNDDGNVALKGGNEKGFSTIQRKVSHTANHFVGEQIREPLNKEIQGELGRGSKLGDHIRVPMEKAFGRNFSNVTIHQDAKSHRLNQALDARAFTVGRDIFFGQGEYNPSGQSGNPVLAHELTHVVQQQGTIVGVQRANGRKRKKMVVSLGSGSSSNSGMITQSASSSSTSAAELPKGKGKEEASSESDSSPSSGSTIGSTTPSSSSSSDSGVVAVKRARYFERGWEMTKQGGKAATTVAMGVRNVKKIKKAKKPKEDEDADTENVREELIELDPNVEDSFVKKVIYGIKKNLSALGGFLGVIKVINLIKQAYLIKYQENKFRETSTRLGDEDDPDTDDEEVAEAAEYAANKRRRAATEAFAKVATKTVTTICNIIEFASIGSASLWTNAVKLAMNIINFGIWAIKAVKKVYKLAKGTLGKNRERYATIIVENALKGHEDAIRLLRELGLIKTVSEDKKGRTILNAKFGKVTSKTGGYKKRLINALKDTISSTT